MRGGHIPGAVNVPWPMNCNDDGTFKTAKELDVALNATQASPEFMKSLELFNQAGDERSAVEALQTVLVTRAKTVEEVKKFNPSVSFPTIVIDGQTIVGFNQEKIDEALKK